MAGIVSERQEIRFIAAVADAVKKNKKSPVTIAARGTTIQGVVGAEKHARNASGGEPYADVVLTLHDKKTLNLSLKGEEALSLAGGGLRGVETALPGIGNKFFRSAYEFAINRLKLNAGDSVPNIFAKLNFRQKLILVIGNKAMGGPIDYMYVGPMNVSARYDERKNTLNFNGALITAEDYAKTTSLYFRLRARRMDQTFDPDAKNSFGVPRIYSRSPSKHDVGGRLVITDEIPANAYTINL